MTDWKETTLWKQLETASGPEADAARALLIQEMPRIQTILTQAHTAPTDFTLHDADHSFRVAKWMAEIIPGDVLEKLSPYEIALLLLAAYLHDIGMTPEQGRVDRFWYHLVYGAPDPKSRRQPLTDEEARDLQGWLDDEGRELTIPLAPDGAASEGTKRLADLLIAHYCRHKHNDWSAEWITTYLRRSALPGCESWIDDLVQLCRSHHGGYDELKQSRFDPRPAGPRGRPMHHRYLACVLRVADVLEIDPERTPEVIFRHREIHPGSVLYWRKDHENWIIRDGNRLVLTAYPESAVLENAIRKTADYIQQELATCARLNREQPFFYWQLRSTQPLPHRWDFPEVLTVHVQPRNDAYVYIDGAFRPNTEKLLELLSGTQLYGDPFVAVRELLQNAFDAVKEEMAYQRLERPNDSEFTKHLPATHRVELRLEERDGRQWLVCKDTGVGMTRRIIENYVLVSGNSRRREIVELDRRCRDAGFRLGRTGQFGIGVLSYFMLADRVEIRTRRSAARADAEATGWSFVTEGVGSFGELQKEPFAYPGTEVRWRLREVLKQTRPYDLGPQQFNEKFLKEYISGLVHYIPCNLEFHGMEDGETTCWKAGWVRSPEELADQILAYENRRSAAGEFLSLAKRKKVEAEQRFADHWRKIARESLRWRIEEGELPNNLGTYRTIIFWFELPGGRCEAFMLVRSEAGRKFITPWGAIIGLLPWPRWDESIYGMGIRRDHSLPESVGWREVNWESPGAGRLRVDRSSLEASTLAHDARRWLEDRGQEIYTEVLVEKPSEYVSLSQRWLKTLRAEPHWILENPEEVGGLIWGPVPFPVALASDFADEGEPISFQGRGVTVLSRVYFSSAGLLPSFFKLSPHKLVARSPRSPSFGIVRLWERAPEFDKHCPLGRISEFPPEWRRICGARFVDEDDDGEYTFLKIWNADHPIISRVDEDSSRWFREKFDWRDLDSATLGEDILATLSRASRILVDILERDNTEDIWTVLLERNPLLADRLLDTAIGLNGTEKEEKWVGYLVNEGYSKQDWKLKIITANSFMMLKLGDLGFESFLHPPRPDWVITEGTSGDEPPEGRP